MGDKTAFEIKNELSNNLIQILSEVMGKDGGKLLKLSNKNRYRELKAWVYVEISNISSLSVAKILDSNNPFKEDLFKIYRLMTEHLKWQTYVVNRQAILASRHLSPVFVVLDVRFIPAQTSKKLSSVKIKKDYANEIDHPSYNDRIFLRTCQILPPGNLTTEDKWISPVVRVSKDSK